MNRGYENGMILMVDDDPDDFVLARDAFEQNGLPSDFQMVADGEELMDYLYHRGKFTDLEGVRLPCLILLDLNMPKKNGWEVLVELKRDPDLGRIPIVVFTTSGAEEDVSRSYELGASSYITKPAKFDALVELMKKLGEYWLDVVRLPKQSTKNI